MFALSSNLLIVEPIISAYLDIIIQYYLIVFCMDMLISSRYVRLSGTIIYVDLIQQINH